MQRGVKIDQSLFFELLSTPKISTAIHKITSGKVHCFTDYSIINSFGNYQVCERINIID